MCKKGSGAAAFWANKKSRHPFWCLDLLVRRKGLDMHFCQVGQKYM